MKSHLLTVLIAACCSLPFFGQTSREIRALQAEQQTLKQQLSESEQLLSSTKKDVAAQLSDANILSGQIAQQRRYVGHLKAQADSMAVAIVRLNVEIDSLSRHLDECKKQYRRALSYLRRERYSLSFITYIFQARNFREMYRRLRYATDFSSFLKEQGETIARMTEDLEDQRTALVLAKQLQDDNVRRAEEEQRALEKRERELRAMIAGLNKKQKQLSSAIAQQRKQMNALDDKIDRLVQIEIEKERKRREEERRRQEALAKQRQQGKQEKNSGTQGATARPEQSSYKVAEEADVKLSSDFASNKGRLPVPITGPYVVSGRFGQYNVAGLKGVSLDNKGINITGQKGAAARCVFDGEVTAVFALSGLQNVIVRHGSYISVYCNLSKVMVKQGQKVAARQTLGTVATDNAGRATLHFQLRRETQKLNPEQWIAK